ncbi:MAG: L-serine ammonia-lyase, partial [Bacteroidota bacterium]
AVSVHLYGSLAKTGKGHGTDIAVMMGLMDYDPVTFPTNELSSTISSVREHREIYVNQDYKVAFDPAQDIHFHTQEVIPYHPNGMRIFWKFQDTEGITETFFSIGGGFVVEEGEVADKLNTYTFPYPIHSTQEWVQYCRDLNCSGEDVVLANECSIRPEAAVYEKLDQIWRTMLECMYLGCHREGQLPGGLKVKRRAHDLHQKLMPLDTYASSSEWLNLLIWMPNPDFQTILKWVSCFALAVNEQNASFGRVVTSPTNGAAGVIPAVLMYMLCFCKETTFEKIPTFLLTASEIGSLFKKHATISAAMGGCQAEIGVSSSMAAGGLTACLGGSIEQQLMAAEIAMEHHLGLTCDPIGGLVQIPCIERNTMGAIKAITACHIALESDPSHAKISLDNVIDTMWETAQDMSHKYKETSEGGLATKVPVSLSDC